MPRIRRVAGNILLFLFIILIFLVALEVFLAVFMPAGSHLWAYDGNIGMKMIENRCSRYISPEYNTEICGNNLGFRDADRDVAKPDGTFRILLLGDSFVAGKEVELNDTFGAILEDRLNEASSKEIEVINMGIGGQGTGAQLLTLRHYGLDMEPDLVILNMFLESDICDNYLPLGYRSYVPLFDLDENGELEYLPIEPAPIVSNPVLNFISQDLFHNIFGYGVRAFRAISKSAGAKEGLLLYYHTYNGNLSGDFEVAWEIEEKIIGEMKEETEGAGAELFAVTLFSREQVTDFEFLKGEVNDGVIEALDPGFPARKMTGILEKYGIGYAHLYPAVMEMDLESPGDLFFRYDAHLNEEGHALTAELIYNALIQNNLIPV